MKKVFGRIKMFVGKQFRAEQTTAQFVFDVFFGAALPLLCFYFDPLVFKSEGFGKPFLADYKPFAYLFSFSSIILLSLWFCFRGQARWLNAIAAGVFLVGGAVCLVIGILLFPLSIIGLIFIIGILGFTPFFTGFVYLRNGVRAMRLAQESLSPKLLANVVLVSAILSFILPAIFNYKINQTMQQMINGDAATVTATAEKLKHFAFFVDLGELKRAYNGGGGKEKTQAIAQAYKTISGKEILDSH